MKEIQKLEIFFGVATFAASSLFMFLVIVPFHLKAENHDSSFNELVIPNLCFLLIPSLLVTVGSLIHGVQSSKIGLILLVIFGGGLAIIYSIAFFSGAMLYAYGLGCIPASAPGFFAAASLFFALKQTNIFERKNNNLP